VGPDSALPLERCDPGTTLAEAASEPEQDVVAAGLPRPLWTAPSDSHPLQPPRALRDAWADEFAARHAAPPGALDPGLARAGIARAPLGCSRWR
jgi:streptomycin 6-kinase